MARFDLQSMRLGSGNPDFSRISRHHALLLNAGAIFV